MSIIVKLFSKYINYLKYQVIQKKKKNILTYFILFYLISKKATIS
jgi:hypothetical protein